MEPDGSQFYKHAGPKNAGYYSTKAQTAAAMRILKKYYSVSGGKVTNFPNFTYIYNIYNGAAHEKIARNIKSKMKAVGIEMSIKGYELEKYMDILDKGNYDLIRYGWAAEANDPLDFLKVFAAGTNENTCKLGTGKHASASIYTVDLKGIGKYKNLKGTWKQTYQQLISYIKEEKNAEIRNKLLHKAEDLLMETACVCPLYYFI
jgi:ABC-type oligopeptide transport system substrate-binding subunit